MATRISPSSSIVRTMLAVVPRTVTAAPAASRRPVHTRALFTKEKAASKPKAKTVISTKTGNKSKKLSQEDSMKEMGGILAQATALGLAVPVGVVGLTEAGKRLSGGSDDAGLYGFILVAAAFAGWWAKKTADRDAIKADLAAKGLDVSTVDNVAVLKWLKAQDELGKGKQAVREIYRAYETESNPWSPFFKPTGVGKSGPKK